MTCIVDLCNFVMNKFNSILKLREVKTGLYKIPCFEMPRFQKGLFETEVTVTSGLSDCPGQDGNVQESDQCAPYTPN